MQHVTVMIREGYCSSTKLHSVYCCILSNYHCLVIVEKHALQSRVFEIINE